MRRQRLLAVQTGIILGLGTVCGWLVLGSASSTQLDQATDRALADPQVRQAAIDRIVAVGDGIYDSHVDADVGRLHLRHLDERSFYGSSISTNGFGMREKAYAWSKHPHTFRIVLLGDSFVLGQGIAVEERIGPFLERELLERCLAPPTGLEILHLAVSAWNLSAECAYLRRQISALRPDLVVHVLIGNDLNDNSGVRGFGGPAFFDPSRPARANGFVRSIAHVRMWGARTQKPLLYALDHESRTRYAEASADLVRLASAVESVGGTYLALAKWTGALPLVKEHLVGDLRPEQWAYISDNFSNDKSTWLSEQDYHWNAAGSERIAHLIYGLIAERNLLPELQLTPSTEAEAAVEDLHRQGVREASRHAQVEQRLAKFNMQPALVFEEGFSSPAGQVYGGIDRTGFVAPYASLILQRGEGTHLRLQAESFPPAGLAGGVARVFVEEFECGSFPLDEGRDLDLSYELPPEVADRPHLNVRFESSDWVYPGQAGERCTSFVLNRVEVL